MIMSVCVNVITAQIILKPVCDAFDEARQKYNEFADIMNEYRHLFDW